MSKLSIAAAKQIDLVNYLSSLGHQPQKIRGTDYWYLSPLRKERTPSFKINRKKNVWYDHGSGQGGNIIDFGTLYHHCSVSDLLNRLTIGHPVSFHPPSLRTDAGLHGAGEKEENKTGKIVIIDVRPLMNPALTSYLESRCIPLDIAGHYCREVDFILYHKKQTAIGFPNDSGGYELRSECFKGSSSPKTISTFDSRSNQLTVFEGFFDFLSYHVINRDYPTGITNFLVLNSLAFFNKAREVMDKYQTVNLYLDRNKKGIECTSQALEWDNKKYINRSTLYRYGQDLNEWLIEKHSLLQKRNLTKLVRHNHRRGRGLKS